MHFLVLLFGKSIYKPYSFLIKIILLSKGVNVGKSFRIHGRLKLTIAGLPKNISIGNNVFFNGDIDIRNRENGKILFEDNVYVDTDCRFIAANNAELIFRESCEIGLNCLINAGASVEIGKMSMVAGYCTFQSSNHGITKGIPIKNQQHTLEKIFIGEDVWIGASAIILPGVTIESGAVIGAQSVVTKNISSNKVAVGIPAKEVSSRI